MVGKKLTSGLISSLTKQNERGQETHYYWPTTFGASCYQIVFLGILWMTLSPIAEYAIYEVSGVSFKDQDVAESVPLFIHPTIVRYKWVMNNGTDRLGMVLQLSRYSLSLIVVTSLVQIRNCLALWYEITKLHLNMGPTTKCMSLGAELF